MVCLRVEPRVAGWKVKTKPLSYGATPEYFFNFKISVSKIEKDVRK